MTSEIAKLRVLVVEDEMLICMDIEDMLDGFGCQVVGPAAKTSQALKILDHSTVDVALLDVNLGSETSYPIADRLLEIGVPFLFSSGYAELDSKYDHYMRIQKPFSKETLSECLYAAYLSKGIPPIAGN